MEYQVVFYTQDNQIRLRYSPHLFKRFWGLPTGRSVRASKENPHDEFRYAATPELAYLLHLECVDLPRQWRSPEFEELVERGKRQSFNRFQANHRTEYVGPALYKTDSFSINGWAYQDEAYDRIDGTEGLALFMEPGCGKTKVICDYLANDPDIHTVLVVGPNHVINEGEWDRQFETHWPWGARPYELIHLTADKSGSVNNRAKIIQEKLLWRVSTKVRIFLINYESIWREPIAQILLEAGFDACVMDESHRIKGPGSKVSKFAAELGDAVPKRFLLTGTPYPNMPLDIFGQYRFLNKTVFGTNFNDFKNRYAIFKQIPDGPLVFERMDPKFKDEFEEKIDKFAIRVKQRPFPVMHEVKEFSLPPSAQKVYDEMEREFFTYINGAEVEASNVLTQIIRLQQIAAGFLPIYEITIDADGNEKKKVVGYDRVHTAKRDFLRDLLEDLPKSKPIIVFALLHEHMNDVRHATESLNLRYGELSGRAKDYQAYIRGEVDVLCIQITAGAEGFNELVRSNIAIYYATGYYLGKYIQSQARLARPGQDAEQILFYHIHAKGTIEGQIYGSLERKESVIRPFMPSLPPQPDELELESTRLVETDPGT